jgi:hypothetical protein
MVYFLYKNECRIFKSFEITIRWGLRQKGEKWRGWTNSGYNTYINGNVTRKPMYNYLKQTKCHCFSFFLYKIREQEDVKGPAWALVPVGREEVGKGCRRVNMVQMLCTRVCKWKNETWWNYSRNGGGGIKENDGRGWIQVWYIWYIIRIFVNATMYPHPTQQ